MLKDKFTHLNRLAFLTIPLLLEGCLYGENQQFFADTNAAGSSTDTASQGLTPASVRLPNATVSATPTPSDPNTIVCNPLDPKNQTDPTLGIQSSLYYIQNFVVGGAYPVTSCDEFLTQGTNANVELFLSDLNVPPENFSAGFKTQTGSLLKKADGTDLVEWFSIRGTSQLQLAPGQDEGDYQLGSMSDDGIQVSIQADDGTWSNVIDHQYPHSANMDCASTTIHMTAGKKVPMKFAYYQGPRVRIALMLMWRKVDSSTATETECGIDHGDDYFFNGNAIPSVPMAPYQAVLNRGWSPLQNQNFLLTAGTNKCVTQ